MNLWRNPSSPSSSSVDQLASSNDWDWKHFRSILISLAGKRSGVYLPASKRPDLVHLDGLLATFAELRSISHASHEREVSRAIFVDRLRKTLVISGRTHIGSTNHVLVDMQPEPGRGWVQIPVMTIHVHPGREKTQGLSDVDYFSFLSDPRQIIMMICYQAGILFAMKTSVTMIASPTGLQARIAEIRGDVTRSWSTKYGWIFAFPDAIFAFNKAVCLEFGMTLFRAPASSETVAHRIEVTQ